MRKKVKPARKGLKVRHPITTAYLPEEGCEVDWSNPRVRTFFARRLRDGDVVVVEPRKAARSAPAAGKDS